MMLYIDEPGLAGLLQQAEGGALIEKTVAATEEKNESVRTGVEAGGGFLSVLGLAKLSALFGKSTKQGQSAGQRLVVGGYAHLERLIEYLQQHGGSSYFLSLDAAFANASVERCSWVCVRDVFALTNLGGELSFDALNHEQRFLFEIDPQRHPHTDRDDYYKNPPRKWHLSMAASFERCPRLKGRYFGVSSHEAIYFRTYGFGAIPLCVFGCYLKSGLRVQIIPYAIWV